MDATALLLLPGLVCTAAAWAPQIAAFEAEQPVIVPDFRGYDSFEAMAQAALARAPARFAVAGHSMGGRVALEILRTAPERVARLALLSTGVHPVDPQEIAPRRALVELAEREGMVAAVRRWLPPMLHPRNRANAALVMGIEAMWSETTPQVLARQVYAALNRRDLRPLLPTIACPTLVLCGAEDSWSPPAQHAEIAAAIPGARLVVVPDCGHMAPLESGEQVTAELRRWLAR